MDPKLLIVGDPDFRRQLAERMAGSGLEVIHAGNFVEAVNAMAGASLVVLKNSLPGSDDLCTQLRADPLTTHLPLVVATAPQGAAVRVKVSAKVPATNFDALERAVRRLTGAHGSTAPAPTGNPLAPAPEGLPAPPPPPGLPPAPSPVSTNDEMSLDQLWSTGPAPAPLPDNGGPDLYGGGSLSEPDALAPEALDMDDEGLKRELFDDDQATRVFRRPDALPGEASEWPPMPPTRDKDTDLINYAQMYTGYLNSIIEGMQSPERLSRDEQMRLLRVSKYTQEDADELLATVQSEVNTSLMNKDLVRMRVLSTAKNRLYDERNTLRTLLTTLKQTLGSVPEEEDSAAALEALLRSTPSADPVEPAPLTPDVTGPLDLNHLDSGPQSAVPEPPGQHRLEASGQHRFESSQPEITSSPANPGPPEPSPGPVRVEPNVGPPDDPDDPLSMDSMSGSFSLPKKSKLTLAAEAKEAAVKQARAAAIQEARQKREKARREAAEKAPSPASRQRSAARKQTASTNKGWLWVISGLALLVGVGLGVRYYWLHRNAGPTKAKVQNAAPVMKWVILEQTHAGIVARPQATDSEGDRVSYTIVWYRNGSEIQGERTARLRPTVYQPGDSVFAEVTPADSYSAGRTMRSQELTVKRLNRKN